MPSPRVRILGLPWLLAGGSGALLTLSFPGSGDQAWLAFAALVPLLVAIDGARRRRAAALGLASGAVFWTLTVAWPAPWVVHYAGIGWPRAALTGVVIVGLLSSTTAAFAAMVVSMRDRSAVGAVLLGATGWVALELLRTSILGFPWNLLGASQWTRLPLIQVAAMTGVYGVSFVVAAVNVALARVASHERSAREALAASAVAAFTVLLALVLGSLGRAPSESTPRVPVAIAQGHIDQSVKWDAAYIDTSLAVYHELTRDAARAGASLVVWPETAVPLHDRNDARWTEIERLARDLGIHLLVGAPHGPRELPRNSAFLIGPDGAVGRYDKRHLLPFAEYVPWRGALDFLSVATVGPVSAFSAGGEATVWDTPLGRIAAVICYEAIFPAETRDFFLAGADVLVNLTNDTWFGPTATPVQHLALATFRAVEHRAWLVRAANSGISAIIAPDGRLVRALPLETRAVLSGSVSRRATTTFYTRHGDVFAWAALAVTVAALAPLRLLRRRPAQLRVPG